MTLLQLYRLERHGLTGILSLRQSLTGRKESGTVLILLVAVEGIEPSELFFDNPRGVMDYHSSPDTAM